MAVVLRLILAAGLVLAASFAHALIPKSTQYYAANNGNIIPGRSPWPTYAAACDDARAWLQSQSTQRTYRVTSTSPGCVIEYQVGSGGAWQSTAGGVVGVADSCPANSTASGGQCQCKAGFEENAANSACQPVATGADKWKQWCQSALGQELGFAEMAGRNTRSGCQNLTMAGSPINTPGYSPGIVPQDAGCTIALGNSKSFPDADGSWYTQGDATVTGGTCREGDPTAGDPAGTEKKPDAKPPACPGGYEGTVNGTSVCAKPDTNKGIDWAGTKKQTNSDGTTTTTESNTTCIGGMCNTTTKETKRDTAGNVTGTSTSTTKESAGSLCARDKGNGACTATGAGGAGGGEGDGNSFNGNCVAGFKAVSEDAVLNAMAEEQYRRNCQLFEKTPDATEESSAYDEMKAKAKAGTDLTDGMDSRFKRTVSIGPGDFDSSSAIGVSACIRDVPIVMSGLTITLPFSRVCPYLEYIGTLLTVVAYLLAARIVVRG